MRRTSKRAPDPGLAPHATVPPNATAMRWTTARPSPTPAMPRRRARPSGRTARRRAAGPPAAMPGTGSSTASTTASPSRPSPRGSAFPAGRACRRCPAGCRATGRAAADAPGPRPRRHARPGAGPRPRDRPWTGPPGVRRPSDPAPAARIPGAGRRPRRGRGTATPRRSVRAGRPGPGRTSRIAAIFLGRALLPQGDLDLSDQDRQRRPQLVRGVAAEPSLPLVGDVQPRQEVVERPAQLVQLVAGPGLVQAPAGVDGVEPARRRDHPRQRRERPPGEPATQQGREQPGPRRSRRRGTSPASRASPRSGRAEPSGQDQGRIEHLGGVRRRSAPGDAAAAREPDAGDRPGRMRRRATRQVAPLPIDQPGRQLRRCRWAGSPLRREIRIDQVARMIDAAAPIVEDHPAQPIRPRLLAQGQDPLLRLPLDAVGMDLGRRRQDRQRRVRRSPSWRSR